MLAHRLEALKSHWILAVIFVLKSRYWIFIVQIFSSLPSKRFKLHKKRHEKKSYSNLALNSFLLFKDYSRHCHAIVRVKVCQWRQRQRQRWWAQFPFKSRVLSKLYVSITLQSETQCRHTQNKCFVCSQMWNNRVFIEMMTNKILFFFGKKNETI